METTQHLATQNMIQIEHLSKNYGPGQLKDVNLSVPRGCIMGFIGENGAGKTTTIKLILNEIHRDGGAIKVMGMDNLADELKIKQEIGVVFDESYFHNEFTAPDVAKIMKRLYRNWSDELFSRYLGQFGIEPNKPVKSYSKGTKMKLSIATALAHKPKLLILDEATSGLDPVMRDEILDILLGFIQEEDHTVFFSSHITSDLEQIADYITFIHNGEIVFTRSKDELLEQFGVLKCSESDFEKLDKSGMLRYRTTEHGCEALVEDLDAARRNYPDQVIDKITLDEIMLLYIKGEKV